MMGSEHGAQGWQWAPEGLPGQALPLPIPRDGNAGMDAHRDTPGPLLTSA